MKKLLIVLVLITSVGFSQKKNRWTKLFNGKDLQGWKQLNGKSKFEVKNGEIVGTTIAKEPNSFLVTEKTFDDFILELEFIIEEGSNSGIQLRSESKPDYMNGRVHGYQMEIDPSARAWTGGIYDEARRDWLYPLEYNVAGKKALKQKEWNKVRIECIGNTLRTFVNDIPTAHVVDDMSSSGFIALQVHSVATEAEAGKQVRFRDIRIQTENLVSSAYDSIFVFNLLRNTLSDQEKKNGVKLLWDGKSTEGWRGAYKDKFPDKGWSIADGTLNVEKAEGVESQHGGDIVTAAEFHAFDLQFEFKLSEGANSGLKYFVTEQEASTGSAIGLEYQILDDAVHPDAKAGVVGNRTLASLYDLIPSLKIKRGLKKIGEWNQGRVIVFPDNRIEHWLNGYKVVEYQRGTPIYQALVARSKYAQWKDFGMAEKGHILLQDHGDNVSFRSIKIQELN